VDKNLRAVEKPTVYSVGILKGISKEALEEVGASEGDLYIFMDDTDANRRLQCDLLVRYKNNG
jgi:GT2 family glycosyltransferase